MIVKLSIPQWASIKSHQVVLWFAGMKWKDSQKYVNETIQKAVSESLPSRIDFDTIDQFRGCNKDDLTYAYHCGEMTKDEYVMLLGIIKK